MDKKTEKIGRIGLKKSKIQTDRPTEIETETD